jgi:AAA+ superfamily predicted ATPase
MKDAARDLELLIRSRYPLITVDTVDEDRLRGLLSRVAGRLDVPLFVWSRTRGLARQGLLKGIYDTTDPLKALGHLAATGHPGVYLLADFHPYLAEPVIQRKLRETLETFTGDLRALVISGHGLEFPPELKNQSVPYRLALPDLEEIRTEMRRLVSEVRGAQYLEVHLSAEEADELAANLRGLTLDEIRRALRRAMLEDDRLDPSDLKHVLDAKRDAVGDTGLLEFFPPAEVAEPVGGMAGLREWLEKRRAALGERAREFGLEPPRGVLLLGVQGCGKSLFARNVAPVWGLPLVRLDPAVLYDKYIGETEKNLRRALETVEAMAPAVLWIDEIEKGFATESGEADGGTSRRLLGTFLTWLQERAGEVFVVATANDVSALPPEMLRKGRFDEIFFIDLPDESERAEILALHLRQRERNPEEFDLPELARESSGFSGAELEQAIVAWLYTAFAEDRLLDSAVLLEEIRTAVPLSVTMAERVQALRAWARDRAVPAA